MLFDMTQKITNLNGEVLAATNKAIADGGEAATLGFACIEALISVYERDDQVSGKVKMDRYVLAQKIVGATLPVSLKSDDVVMIKELCAKRFGTLIYGRVADMLEHGQPEPEQKAAA